MPVKWFFPRGERIYQLRMKRQTWLVTGATGLIGSASHLH